VADERYVVAVRLKPGTAEEAERQLAAGPPFDPAEVGLLSHAAYISNDDVYLQFGGQAAHSIALQVAREHLVEVGRWQSIVEGLPTRVAEVPANARCLYHWQAEKAE
jgi:hypothetical protein